MRSLLVEPLCVNHRLTLTKRRPIRLACTNPRAARDDDSIRDWWNSQTLTLASTRWVCACLIWSWWRCSSISLVGWSRHITSTLLSLETFLSRRSDLIESRSTPQTWPTEKKANKQKKMSKKKSERDEKIANRASICCETSLSAKSTRARESLSCVCK